MQDGKDHEAAVSGMEDDEDLDKTLSIERFGDLISKSVWRDQEKQGRSYSERDFECMYIMHAKLGLQLEQHRPTTAFR